MTTVPNENLSLGNNVNPQPIPVSEPHSGTPNRRVNPDNSRLIGFGDVPCLPRESQALSSNPLNSLFMQGGHVLNVHDWDSTRRMTWDDYFLHGAQWVSLRADCSRRKVGAMIVKGNRVVSTGYNGSPAGSPKSCLKGDCPRGKSDVPAFSSYDTGPGACIAVHAEANALLYADREDCKGATLYLTCAPCDGCKRLIEAAGIARVVWQEYPKHGQSPAVTITAVPGVW